MEAFVIWPIFGSRDTPLVHTSRSQIFAVVNEESSEHIGFWDAKLAFLALFRLSDVRATSVTTLAPLEENVAVVHTMPRAPSTIALKG